MRSARASSAVAEAIELLRRRQSELQDNMRQLSLEIERIDRAITALGDPGGTESRRVPDEEAATLDVSSAPAVTNRSARHLSVRRYVQETLEREERAWSSAELIDAIERDVKLGIITVGAKNISASVRSALWALTSDKIVRRTRDERVIATCWPQTPTEQLAREER